MASRTRRTTASGRVPASLLTVLLTLGLAGTATAQYVSAPEPPRRHVVLPGLESHELLVDPSEPWYDRALAGLQRAHRSFVVVQNAQHPDWPPLSGYVIGPRHVVTAHLDELQPGVPPPRFLIRTTTGRILEGAQVAGWERWDFGVIGFDEDLGVPPIEFGDDAAMRRGDVVLNIGNPSAVGRSGLALTAVGTFLRLQDGYFVGDISTLAGGSGGPILDLDGRLIGMSSFGMDIPVPDITEITVAELRLRSAVAIDRGGSPK